MLGHALSGTWNVGLTLPAASVGGDMVHLPLRVVNETQDGRTPPQRNVGGSTLSGAHGRGDCERRAHHQPTRQRDALRRLRAAVLWPES